MNNGSDFRGDLTQVTFTYYYGVDHPGNYDQQVWILFIFSGSFVSHLAIAVTTLVILFQKRISWDRKNALRVRNIHALFTLLLLVLGAINMFAYLATSNIFTDTYCYPAIGSSPVGSYLDPNRWSVYIDLTGVHKIDIRCSTLTLFEVGDIYWQEVPAFLIAILAEFYLLYRCHLLLGRRLLFTAGPLLILLCNLILGGLCLYNINTLSTWIYWIISLTFNLLVNAIIAIRLFHLRARVKKALGPEYGRVYAGLAAMLIESSVLYSVVLALAYLFLPANSFGPAYRIFSPVVCQIEAIASELIILRFALESSMTPQQIQTVTKRPYSGSDTLEEGGSNPAETQPASQQDGKSRWRLVPAAIGSLAANFTISLRPSSLHATAGSGVRSETSLAAHDTSVIPACGSSVHSEDARRRDDPV